MKTQPKLLRLLTPPPLTQTNLQGQTLQTITRNALSLHLTKSMPTSAPRTSPFKLQMTTLHPSQPLVAYVLSPEERDKKIISKTVVVQHCKTRAIVWSMSLGEIANTLFDYNILSQKSAEKQYKIMKDMGQVQRLNFFDPSTLYWSGHGTVTDPQDAEQRWSHLFVQFSNCIVIVNLRRRSFSLSKGSTGEGVFKPIVAHITQKSLGGSMINSNALPVSQHKFIVGTNDGYLKMYNWKTNKIIQSIKILTIKNDSIVHICSANKYGTPEYYASATRRIVCLSKKGTAYLMELQVTDNVVNGISSPICKFEGGSVPSSMSKQDDDHSSMEHNLLQYCAFRDLLLWSSPSRKKENLMIWDLSNLPEPDEKQWKKNELSKADPILVIQFPYDNISHTTLNGWFHESIPMECVATAAVTKEGAFQVLLSPLHGSGSSMKAPFAASTVLSVNLNQIIQRDMSMSTEKEVHIKVQSIYCLSLRDSSTFYFGTNVGIAMVRMVDGNLIPVPGGLHAHLNANHGSLGKSILSVKNHEIFYGSLEPPGGSTVVNPIGPMESKNNIVVYESPPPLHLPPEIHKRPVRLPPLFLPSPSCNHLCCFWKEEMRYEVLHIPTMLDRVTSRGQTKQSPLVASGEGISSFAWVGDDDVFSLLYHPEQDLLLKVGIDLSAPHVTLGKELSNAALRVTDVKKLKQLKNLKEIMSLNAVNRAGKSVVHTAGKLQTLKGLQEIGTGTGKAALKFGKGSVNITKKIGLGTAKVTTKLAVGTARGTTKLAVGTGKLAVKTGKKGTKMAVGGTSKMLGGAANVATFGLLSKKKKEKEEKALSTEVGEDGTVKTNSSIGSTPDLSNDTFTSTEPAERKFPWVELRGLVESTRVDGSTTATASKMGELALRTGNRNPPTILFGGPVLCVGSKYDENDEGLAYFYTQKMGENEDSAASFVSSGPAFPCPDIVAWDDDGRLCAVVIQSRVSIYLSEQSDFTMLGIARLGSAIDTDVQVTSARFIHGTLYCSTRSSIQCIFLGDLEGGVCHLDVFTLTSSDVSTLPSKTIASDFESLTPPTIPLPFNHPTILGYQNGSLVISTVSGVQAIPLGSPLLRIGSLIAAGHAERAELWFNAVSEVDHEALATFLERRGAPFLALQLSGLSLETMVDLCMRFGFTDRLEQIVQRYELKDLRAIDMSRGVSSNIFGPEDYGASIVVCVGAFLLSQGRAELVRRMATECLSVGDGDEGGKREGFILASLLLSVKGSDSKRVIERSIERIQSEEDWPIGHFVRDHIFASGGRV
jgi:hypothetical protein